MITAAILYLIYGAIFIISAPLRLLSDASLPENITSAISTANGYLSIFNFVFPVDTFLAILALTLVIEGFILLYKLIKWVWNKIPGVN